MGAALLKGLFAVGTKLLVAAASETVIEWAFFYVAEAIVKSTKTPHDDAFLEELRDNYGKKPNKEE